ncbi:MAG: AAA family ATPase, partial [Planctomycetota bacterium]
QSDPDVERELISGEEVGTIARILSLPTTTILKLVSPDHPLVSHGILEVEQGIRASLLDYEVKIAPEVVKVLRGFPLNTDEYFKIQGTPVAYLLQKIETFRNLIPKVGELGEEEEEEEEDFESEEWDEEKAEAFLKEMENFPEDLEDLSLEEYLRQEMKEEKKVELAEEEDFELEDKATLRPYRDDLEYLEDQFEWLTLICKIHHQKQEKEENRYRSSSERSPESILRELFARERLLRNRNKKRLALTMEQQGKEPRLERLCRHKNLDEFEKNVLLFLIAYNISFEFRKIMSDYLMRSMIDVGTLIEIFVEGLKNRVECRKYFYKNAPLVRGGLVNIDSYYGDLLSASIDIDRRMLDFLVGLETEFEELVEGSHLYMPKVTIDRVILPEEQKNIIINTVKSFPSFLEARKKLGFQEVIPYGNSIVMLFYGPSGTGKTMMANGIANYLGKRVLLVNYPSLGDLYSDEVLKVIFREATINDAIVFFDECEGIFEHREHNPGLSLLLTELERYEGIIIMATNRPQVIDEAMNRRITLAIEFPKPDYLLRKEIWKNHLPEKIKLADDVNIDSLALRYELTGGLIKNAIITALSFAVREDSDEIVLSQKFLEEGARLQLSRHLSLSEFDKKLTPTQGLSSLVLPKDVMNILEEIVMAERARQVLYGQWGFEEKMGFRGKGISVLFHGPPGTGKTFAAEALGYELGRPLKLVNLAALLSKFVGDTEKNIESIFKEAQAHNSIIFFDEADSIFAGRTSVYTSTDRYANADVDLLLHLIENFEGIVILTTNLLENTDPAFFRRFRYVVSFPMPDSNLRKQLWQSLIPPQAPVDPKINFDDLARKYELTGGHIKNAIIRAATRVAIRKSKKPMIRQKDLEKAAEEEFTSLTNRIGFSG